jgi:putative FmdB family regulatory protein
MPIYEYECKACGTQHEFIQKFSEAPKRKCPECGKLRLRKLMSAAAFHLKGGGWYVTDFRDGDKKKAADGDAAAKSSGESATEPSASAEPSAKSDAGPAEKTSSESAGKTDSKTSAKADSKSATKAPKSKPVKR